MMAVEYNKWTGNRDDYEQLAQELIEVLSDTPIAYVKNLVEGETRPNLIIGFDEKNYVKIGYGTASYLSREGSTTKFSGNSNVGFHTMRYFAKENGELLLSSIGSGVSCLQIGIGPCSDGQWGIALAYSTDDSNANDYIETLCLNEPSQKHGLVVDATPGKMYLVIRNAVRYDDITFDDLFFNCYGYVDSWSVIQFNGERYAVGNRGTTHNTNMLMKL